MFEYLIAVGAGLISFLSPCVLPLIPGYISYISGQSLQEILNQKKINFFPLILFCLGFSSVFVILGASASFLGQALLQNSEVLRISAGIVIIIFSLQLIGIINIPYLNFEKRFDAKESRNPSDNGHKFAITSWQVGRNGNWNDDIRWVIAGQAMILAALVKCFSDSPCYLPKFMMVSNKLVEGNRLR